jgi:hypothetical protein
MRPSSLDLLSPPKDVSHPLARRAIARRTPELHVLREPTTADRKKTRPTVGSLPRFAVLAKLCYVKAQQLKLTIIME